MELLGYFEVPWYIEVSCGMETSGLSILGQTILGQNLTHYFEWYISIA